MAACHCIHGILLGCLFTIVGLIFFILVIRFLWRLTPISRARHDQRAHYIRSNALMWAQQIEAERPAVRRQGEAELDNEAAKFPAREMRQMERLEEVIDGRGEIIRERQSRIRMIDALVKSRGASDASLIAASGQLVADIGEAETHIGVNVARASPVPTCSRHVRYPPPRHARAEARPHTRA